MKVDLSLEVLAIMTEAIGLAGDGGIDPFTEKEREKVRRELEPYMAVVSIYGRKYRSWRDIPPYPKGLLVR